MALDASNDPRLIGVHSRELPSNLLLRRLGARSLLAFCVVAWGAVQLGMGFVPSWGLLAFCRVLLGALEVRQWNYRWPLSNLSDYQSIRPVSFRLWSLS